MSLKAAAANLENVPKDDLRQLAAKLRVVFNELSYELAEIRVRLDKIESLVRNVEPTGQGQGTAASDE